MQNCYEPKLPAAQPDLFGDIAPRSNPHPSSNDWRPEPCGLTRQELRSIVAERLSNTAMLRFRDVWPSRNAKAASNGPNGGNYDR